MNAKVQSKLNVDGRVALQDVIPLDTPFLLYVDPSSACNFACQFCPTGHRDLLRASEYKRSVMHLALFEKLIRDLEEFRQPLKVMRMNKIGEPLLNKNLPTMISLAKASGRVRYIDLATNAALFEPDLLTRLIDAGLDRLNISLEGVSREQYAEHAKVDVDFDRLVDSIRWLYPNSGNCEVTIKIPGNYLTPADRDRFFSLFGEYCDRIFVEELAPIWPDFDVKQRAGIHVQEQIGQYGQSLHEKEVCTYIFYAMAVNADGTVSACCPDWDQKLVIGDLRCDSLHAIWNSSALHRLRLQHLSGGRGEHPLCRGCGHITHAQTDNIDAYKTLLFDRL
ncbi:MAG: radical SAM protein, partial [Nitrospira sp.]|nr:radical SAM protein [Nitrospira sp.]